MSDQTQITQHEESTLERVVEYVAHLGERVVQTVRAFFLNMSINVTDEGKNKIRQRYVQEPEGLLQTSASLQMDEQVLALMNETFHGQHPGEYLLGCAYEVRQATLETFSRKLLDLYGLHDVRIVSDYLEMGLCGAYSFNRRILILNKSYMLIDDKYILLDALDTVIHEARHAMQHAAAYDHNPLGFTQETIVTWVKNFNHYIECQNDPIGYENQPIEADATASARHIMHIYLQNHQISL